MELAVRGGGVEGRDVVDGDPKIVVGGEDGKAHQHERAAADQQRSSARFMDGSEERDLIELAATHVPHYMTVVGGVRREARIVAVPVDVERRLAPRSRVRAPWGPGEGPRHRNAVA